MSRKKPTTARIINEAILLGVGLMALALGLTLSLQHLIG